MLKEDTTSVSEELSHLQPSGRNASVPTTPPLPEEQFSNSGKSEALATPVSPQRESNPDRHSRSYTCYPSRYDFPRDQCTQCCEDPHKWLTPLSSLIGDRGIPMGPQFLLRNHTTPLPATDQICWCMKRKILTQIRRY